VVVDEDTAANDSFFAPCYINGISLIRGLALECLHTSNTVDVGFVLSMDVIKGYSIVEASLLLVAKMPKSVPLATALGIKAPCIVIYNTRRLLVDIFVKDLTTEKGYVVLGVERPIK
jgi:hypothetical protein